MTCPRIALFESSSAHRGSLKFSSPAMSGEIEENMMRIFVPSEDGPFVDPAFLVPYQPGLICVHSMRAESGQATSIEQKGGVTADPDGHIKVPEA
jgi:hypothetical protein